MLGLGASGVVPAFTRAVIAVVVRVAVACLIVVTRVLLPSFSVVSFPAVTLLTGLNPSAIPSLGPLLLLVSGDLDVLDHLLPAFLVLLAFPPRIAAPSLLVRPRFRALLRHWWLPSLGRRLFCLRRPSLVVERSPLLCWRLWVSLLVLVLRLLHAQLKLRLLGHRELHALDTLFDLGIIFLEEDHGFWDHLSRGDRLCGRLR